MPKTSYFILDSGFNLLTFLPKGISSVPLLSLIRKSPDEQRRSLAVIDLHPAAQKAYLRPFHAESDKMETGSFLKNISKIIEVEAENFAPSKYFIHKKTSRPHQQQKYSLTFDFEGKCRWDQPKNPSALRLLARSELDLLLWGFSQEWALSPEGPVVKIHAQMSDLDTLSFGKFTLNFNEALNVLRTAKKEGQAVFNEGWKVWRIALYRPLIVMEIFPERDAYPEAFTLSLERLFHFSKFQDSLLVVSSRPRFEILSLLEAQTLQAIEKLEEAGKFYFWEVAKPRWQCRNDILFNLPAFGEFQPILFTRSNILTQPHFCEILPKMGLAREIWCFDQPQNPALRGNDKDTDILMIPSLRAHQYTLRGAAAYLSEKAANRDEREFDKIASCAFSYALHRLEDVNFEKMQEIVVRTDKEAAHPLTMKYLVHFASDPKEEMSQFIALSLEFSEFLA